MFAQDTHAHMHSFQLRAGFCHSKVNVEGTWTLKLHINYTVKKDAAKKQSDNTTPVTATCIAYFVTHLHFGKLHGKGPFF